MRGAWSCCLKKSRRRAQFFCPNGLCSYRHEPQYLCKQTRCFTYMERKVKNMHSKTYRFAVPVWDSFDSCLNSNGFEKVTVREIGLAVMCLKEILGPSDFSGWRSHMPECWAFKFCMVVFVLCSFLTSPSPAWWSTFTRGRRLAHGQVWWIDMPRNGRVKGMGAARRAQRLAATILMRTLTWRMWEEIYLTLFASWKCLPWC